MTDNGGTMQMQSAESDQTPVEYENVRREMLAKYNSLLLDAQGRLLAAMRHVERQQTTAGTDDRPQLAQKIRELIDYLDRARL
ncbi:MAG: hypothetical protein FJ280_12280 [Planctomycetes bacterium]|nr:hypothetical protein [Planctomycetota bacterium]